MNQSFQNTLTCSVALILISITPVSGQDQTAPAVAETVNEIFFDSKGHLWLGTLSEGVGYYNGLFLSYLTMKDGLCGNTITEIMEGRVAQVLLFGPGGVDDTNLFDARTQCNAIQVTKQLANHHPNPSSI